MATHTESFNGEARADPPGQLQTRCPGPLPRPHLVPLALFTILMGIHWKVTTRTCLSNFLWHTQNDPLGLSSLGPCDKTGLLCHPDQASFKIENDHRTLEPRDNTGHRIQHSFTLPFTPQQFPEHSLGNQYWLSQIKQPGWGV